MGYDTCVCGVRGAGVRGCVCMFVISLFCYVWVLDWMVFDVRVLLDFVKGLTDWLGFYVGDMC